MVAHWPLIGRREELSIIHRTLGEGQYRGLLLAGAPGVGKTRLAREALAAAAASGCETNWAVASRAVAAIPFGALEGMWRWTGPVSAPPQLAELIQARIGTLTPALRDLGELVAFGEPMAFSVLARAGVSAADVEAAERAGLLSTEEAGTDIRVRLGHPLFGEVIRCQTPQMRRRTVHTTLAEAAGSVGGLRSEDAVRIAVWHLEAGTLPEPELLVAAAGWALAALDYQLTEQLCLAAGGSRGRLHRGPSHPEQIQPPGQTASAQR
jgi:AAA ATPase domain